MNKNQHVVPKGHNWAVRGAGNPNVTSTHRTQGAAIERARTIARQEHAEVVIHRSNGQIRDKDSYGRDTDPPRDTKH